MDSALFRRYVRMIIAETPLARVPNQLLPPKRDGEVRQKKDDGEDEIEEFSAAGGMGTGFGYTGPLGMDPNDLGRQKNAGGKRKKKRGK